MSKPKLRILDIAAFVLTILATVVHLAGFFIPNWWTYQSATSGEKEEVGMIKSTRCDINGNCLDKTAIVIEGGKGVCMVFFNLNNVYSKKRNHK